ncbi:THO complex subunit 5 -like protein [Halotydeus destructor]|nr:THO complex subunit 5 -like protein [Halotydeus destructor]
MKGDVKQTDSSYRKTRVVDSRSSSSTSESKLATKANANSVQIDYVNLTKESLEYEEKEATARSASQNEIQFSKTCKEIRTLMAEMISFDDELQIKETRKRILMLMLSLKKLNRYDKLQNKAIKETVASSKTKLDKLHLQFENLLYETTYLQKEISKCREFKSKVGEVDLVSLEEFNEKAPEEIAKLVDPEGNEQKQTLARLEFELFQRKELSEELKTGEKRKSGCLEKVDEAKSELDKLHPQFKSVIDIIHSTKESLAVKSDQ